MPYKTHIRSSVGFTTMLAKLVLTKVGTALASLFTGKADILVPKVDFDFLWML